MDTALAAIAGNTRSRLKSLALHCPTSIQPNVRVLRRLCSSAHQLSLSANELLLMAWGTDALYDQVWMTHSVESFALLASSILFFLAESWSQQRSPLRCRRLHIYTSTAGKKC